MLDQLSNELINLLWAQIQTCNLKLTTDHPPFSINVKKKTFEFWLWCEFIILFWRREACSSFLFSIFRCSLASDVCISKWDGESRSVDIFRCLILTAQRNPYLLHCIHWFLQLCNTFHRTKFRLVVDKTDNSLTYLILLYSVWSALNSMFSFNVSIPGASRQRYLPFSKCGTTRASFGSLRWVMKLPFSSRTIQCLWRKEERK